MLNITRLLSPFDNNHIYKRIVAIWSPLCLTWMLMALEGPLIASIIARCENPKVNLAAYGLAFAIGLLLEAPIIMMLSAATALVKDRHSYHSLRAFSFFLNIGCTVATLFVLWAPIFKILVWFLGTPNEVNQLFYQSLWYLVPWPAAIGIRRFYQGVLIVSRRSHLVTIGTVFRLTIMSLTCIGLYFYTVFPGATIGCISLSVGVVTEAMVIWLLSQPSVKLLHKKSAHPNHIILGMRAIAKFYYPLALTSIVALLSQPMVSFFVGRCAMPLESLAIIPVVNSALFFFRAIGLSFQEVTIYLLGMTKQSYFALRNFSFSIGGLLSLLFLIFVFSSLCETWYRDVVNLDKELAKLAVFCTKLLLYFPCVSFLNSFYRAVLVESKKTLAVQNAVLIEVSMIALVLTLAIYFQWNGAIATFMGIGSGRLISVIFMRHQSKGFRKALKYDPSLLEEEVSFHIEAKKAG